jgi:hypothetical protein
MDREGRGPLASHDVELLMQNPLMSNKEGKSINRNF